MKTINKNVRVEKLKACARLKASRPSLLKYGLVGCTHTFPQHRSSVATSDTLVIVHWLVCTVLIFFLVPTNRNEDPASFSQYESLLAQSPPATAASIPVQVTLVRWPEAEAAHGTVHSLSITVEHDALGILHSDSLETKIHQVEVPVSATE